MNAGHVGPPQRWEVELVEFAHAWRDYLFAEIRLQIAAKRAFMNAYGEQWVEEFRLWTERSAK